MIRQFEDVIKLGHKNDNIIWRFGVCRVCGGLVRITQNSAVAHIHRSSYRIGINILCRLHVKNTRRKFCRRRRIAENKKSVFQNRSTSEGGYILRRGLWYRAGSSQKLKISMTTKIVWRTSEKKIWTRLEYLQNCKCFTLGVTKEENCTVKVRKMFTNVKNAAIILNFSSWSKTSVFYIF